MGHVAKKVVQYKIVKDGNAICLQDGTTWDGFGKFRKWADYPYQIVQHPWTGIESARVWTGNRYPEVFSVKAFHQKFSAF